MTPSRHCEGNSLNRPHQGDDQAPTQANREEGRERREGGRERREEKPRD